MCFLSYYILSTKYNLTCSKIHSLLKLYASYPDICQSVGLSVCLSLCLTLCLSVSLSVCISICIFVCLSVSLSLPLSHLSHDILYDSDKHNSQIKSNEYKIIVIVIVLLIIYYIYLYIPEN